MPANENMKLAVLIQSKCKSCILIFIGNYDVRRCFV